jgi:hypothetical protein
MTKTVAKYTDITLTSLKLYCVCVCVCVCVKNRLIMRSDQKLLHTTEAAL